MTTSWDSYAHSVLLEGISLLYTIMGVRLIPKHQLIEMHNSAGNAVYFYLLKATESPKINQETVLLTGGSDV